MTVLLCLQGMIGFMDEVIGNISESLRVKQMYESTIIVYSSDNVRSLSY